MACAVVFACVSAGFAAPPAAAAAHWQRPVAGPVSRAFDYGGDPFAAGRHRGVDFAVRPGQPVRSACAGRVVFAGTAGANGPTASVRCGHWRVAYLPLRTLAVRRGARVARGARLGSAAAGSGRHPGLHVGVRREGRRWAYVDPMGFFGDPQPPVGPVPREVRRRRWRGPGPVAETPAVVPRAVPLPDPRAPAHPRPTRLPPPARALPPWFAWVGLALVLAGVSGSGLRLARRRHAFDGRRRGPDPTDAVTIAPRLDSAA